LVEWQTRARILPGGWKMRALDGPVRPGHGPVFLWWLGYQFKLSR
jgi:hypothetical protein